jgi:hypothetical protein
MLVILSEANNLILKWLSSVMLLKLISNRMIIDEDYRNLIEEKYREMKSLNRNEDILNEKTLGGIKIFINSKPKYCLTIIHFEPDDIVYIGSNEM